ncbi:hypothetical protein [Hymenobacter sp. YC55]|uniref:hypothetical protein n=1 Tax=Hymenobacter sp. YC55 TaxID=3034019 RepID=UPI0023F6FA83|nr:hypothetical protein [Hymenobacter sp. YC55]MDF7815120.1 hypothetical protein [Hymenobacter sp. YC55]
MPLLPCITCLLAYLEDGLCCLAERVFGKDQPRTVAPTISAPGGASNWEASSTLAEPRVYRVRYQLTEAVLREGRVVASYVVPCVRLFDTEELTVIWAELVDELGPSPYRLGLEILAVDAYLPPVRPATPSWSGA